MQPILYPFLIITSSLLIKQYSYNTAIKKKLKYYLLLIFTVWLIFLTIYLFHSSPSIFDAEETRLEIIFFVLFTLASTFFMIYLRMLFNNSYWYLLLLIPVTYLCFLNIMVFNEPVYNGAMDGFATIIKYYVQQKIIMVYPVFVFTFSMTKCHPKIKAIALFIFVIVTGVLGVQQSIGREGYLADRTGDIFVVLLLILAAIATYSFFRNNKPAINKD